MLPNGWSSPTQADHRDAEQAALDEGWRQVARAGSRIRDNLKASRVRRGGGNSQVVGDLGNVKFKLAIELFRRVQILRRKHNRDQLEL